MAGKTDMTRKRSYSPVYRARGLNHEDEDEVYIERIAEMAVEMDQALDYLKDIGSFLQAK